MTPPPHSAPVVVCGLGPIGIRAAELARESAGVAALVDIDVAAARSRLDSSWDHTLLVGELDTALAQHPGAPVLLCTCSDFPRIVPDLAAAAQRGSSVLTTCEEALWPFARYPEEARVADDALKTTEASALAVGINPGFLMDLLPVVLATPYPQPDCIVVERKVDVGQRRGPLQQKVGLGLTPEEFDARKRSVGIGHRGLDESMHFVAAALGVEWDHVESDTVAVIATTDYSCEGRPFPEGSVIGMHNFGTASLAGKVRLRMDLEMSLRIDEPVDRVTLEGDAPLPASWVAPRGVPGDAGTAHVLMAALAQLQSLPSGLCTLLDIPGGLRPHWG